MTATVIKLPRFDGKICPAVQMREFLLLLREQGAEFDEAWRVAFERVKWPHDTVHRREWKAILEQSRETWERAFDLVPPSRAERKLGRLLLAA